MDENERRRAKLESVWTAWQADPTYHQRWEKGFVDRDARAAEALQLLDALRATRDVEAFRSGLQAWTERPGYEGFKGFGLMFVHQVVNYTDDSGLSSNLLIDCLTAPESDEDAAAKIRRFVAHIEKIKKGGQPATRRTVFVLSLFWSMADHDRWPCLWSSASEILASLSWLPALDDLDEWYLGYCGIVRASGHTPFEVEQMLWWLHTAKPFTGLDPSLVERSTENLRLAEAFKANGDAYPSPDEAHIAERNIRAVLGDLRMVGTGLEPRVGSALGRTVVSAVASAKYSSGPFRSDAYLSWRTGSDSQSPALWLWVTEDGVAVGLHPGWREQGWMARARRELEPHVPPTLQMIQVRERIGNRLVPGGQRTDTSTFLVGRFYPETSALGDPLFVDEIESIAAATQPLVDRLGQLASGGDDDLAALVARFCSERPYPTPHDLAQEEGRVELAAGVNADSLTEFNVVAFRKLANSNKYGFPGPQAILNVSLKEATADDLLALAGAIDYLLWHNEEDPIARRIDRLLDPDDLGMKGLGEAVIMKLLAVTFPREFLATYPYRGDSGKRRALELLEMDPLDEASLTRGELQVTSNAALRDRLAPLFPDDPWGIAQFLFWLTSGGAAKGAGDVETEPDLASLEAELLLETGFLQTVVELLDDKRQVIFYGPPGTGKTYIANKLAEAIVPDSSRRSIVQFHPSTSYEDFFEGFRPRTSDDGTMTYELVGGPLARIASLAAQSPTVQHVMVIDEINRANLPKVFGELLFLLEYRDEEISTLYRPDEPFRLPKNLWFIGTMNTADRSIALVDAAMRRRFHFVPFFPEQDQMQGLLLRWLEKHDGDPRIASLVEQVNEQLVNDIGENLQIGPSYFMKEGIDDAGLRRIWKYSIEPYIEEQLFGQTEAAKEYGFDEVRERYWSTLTGPAPTDAATDEFDPPDESA